MPLEKLPSSFNEELLYYIAGPMTGIEKYNYPAFEKALTELQDLGVPCLSPHSPFQYDTAKLHASRSYQWYIKAALRMQLRCDGIILLPGWSTSRGARREADIAMDLAWPLWYYDGESLIPLDKLR